MKKAFFSLAIALCAVAFMSSCGSSDSKSEQADSIAAVEAKPIDQQIIECNSIDDAKAIIADAKAKAEEIAKTGNVQEAKDYLEKVKDAVKQKYPELAETVCCGACKADSLVNEGAETVDNVKATVENVKEAGEQAVEQGKQKAADVKEAVGNTKDKVNALLGK